MKYTTVLRTIRLRKIIRGVIRSFEGDLIRNFASYHGLFDDVAVVHAGHLAMHVNVDFNAIKTKLGKQGLQTNEVLCSNALLGNDDKIGILHLVD
ncbi:hypothetical protein BX600DRAFT_107677 [Xylariales sp. PMI_506]|nr:hypothetical protein BX600DRAFT_107677 [Xylariales sp. PMI_506]